MPAPLMPRDQVVLRLMPVFRKHGYDGASLAGLSEATGLGKSSLYHYFPGGKADMAEQVLVHLEADLETALFEPLSGSGSPQAKLDAMLAALSSFYEGGKRACLLERLCASVDYQRFRRPLARIFEKWIHAVEKLCREAGLPKALARRRAEDLVVRVEGALVVSAGTGETAIFARTLEELSVSSLAAGRAAVRRP